MQRSPLANWSDAYRQAVLDQPITPLGMATGGLARQRHEADRLRDVGRYSDGDDTVEHGAAERGWNPGWHDLNAASRPIYKRAPPDLGVDARAVLDMGAVHLSDGGDPSPDNPAGSDPTQAGPSVGGGTDSDSDGDEADDGPEAAPPEAAPPEAPGGFGDVASSVDAATAATAAAAAAAAAAEKSNAETPTVDTTTVDSVAGLAAAANAAPPSATGGTTTDDEGGADELSSVGFGSLSTIDGAGKGVSRSDGFNGQGGDRTAGLADRGVAGNTTTGFNGQTGDFTMGLADMGERGPDKVSAATAAAINGNPGFGNFGASPASESGLLATGIDGSTLLGGGLSLGFNGPSFADLGLNGVDLGSLAATLGTTAEMPAVDLMGNTTGFVSAPTSDLAMPSVVDRSVIDGILTALTSLTQNPMERQAQEQEARAERSAKQQAAERSATIASKDQSRLGGPEEAAPPAAMVTSALPGLATSNIVDFSNFGANPISQSGVSRNGLNGTSLIDGTAMSLMGNPAATMIANSPTLTPTSAVVDDTPDEEAALPAPAPPSATPARAAAAVAAPAAPVAQEKDQETDLLPISGRPSTVTPNQITVDPVTGRAMNSQTGDFIAGNNAFGKAAGYVANAATGMLGPLGMAAQLASMGLTGNTIGGNLSNANPMTNPSVGLSDSGGGGSSQSGYVSYPAPTSQTPSTSGTQTPGTTPAPTPDQQARIIAALLDPYSYGQRAGQHRFFV